ncbi:globin domain-containing protein [Nocardia altamirensis]|uniref:globin domain-containing protein n=1 Tax=Nocardia altamirensis TaxID=472158 RepID=UPI0008400E9A|nr:globin [Nocardia altamirensis]
MPSLFEHVGGDAVLHRVETAFYDKALADPVLKTLFTERLPDHVDHLTWFTAESFGGPDRFSRALGFDYLIAVHRSLAITDAQRERFIEVYMESFEEAGLFDNPDFRQAVYEHVSFGAQVAQQNSHAKTDAQLHPIREVPHWTWAGD